MQKALLETIFAKLGHCMTPSPMNRAGGSITASCFLLAGPSRDVFFTTPHPIEGQGCSILLVDYSMIILKPAIF